MNKKTVLLFAGLSCFGSKFFAEPEECAGELAVLQSLLGDAENEQDARVFGFLSAAKENYSFLFQSLINLVNDSHAHAGMQDNEVHPVAQTAGDTAGDLAASVAEQIIGSLTPGSAGNVIAHQAATLVDEHVTNVVDYIADNINNHFRENGTDTAVVNETVVLDLPSLEIEGATTSEEANVEEIIIEETHYIQITQSLNIGPDIIISVSYNFEKPAGIEVDCNSAITTSTEETSTSVSMNAHTNDMRKQQHLSASFCSIGIWKKNSE